MSKVLNSNKFTGEVMAFRTQFHKTEYCDNEYSLMPSMTDTSEYEDINTTIDKCARSGALQEFMKKMNISKDNENVSFDDYDETQDSDYDISQAKQTLDDLQNKVNSASEVSNSSETEGQTSVASANEGETNSSVANTIGQ